MKRVKTIALLAVFGLLLAATKAQAGGCQPCEPMAPAIAAPCGNCAPPPCPQPSVVERTCYVPTLVTEQRTVTVTKCKPETRERTVTVYHQVPETRTVAIECTVLARETRTRPVTVTVCKPVLRTVEQQCTVMVPHTENREQVRTVCQMVSVKETVTVCEASGHWETRAVASSCGCGGSCGGNCGCGGSCGQACATNCRVWVPELARRQVEVTCMKPSYVQQTYQCPVTVCRPEVRTRTVQVCETQREQVTQQIAYTVCVPQKHVENRQVTTFRCVAEERKEPYTVMVPYQEQHQVQVQVCKMVAQKVQVPACGCAPARAPVCAPCR